MTYEATITNENGTIITFDLVIEGGRVIEVDGAHAESPNEPCRTCTLNHTATEILYNQHMEEITDAIDWDGIAAGRYA